MPQFVEALAGTFGTPTFETVLDQQVTTLQNALGHNRTNAERGVMCAPMRVQYNGYDRQPQLNNSYFANYSPYRFLAQVMSMTEHGFDPRKPKGHRFEIRVVRARGTAELPNDHFLLDMLDRRLHMDDHGAVATHFEVHGVKIFHCAQDAEYQHAKEILDNTMNVTFDQGLSAMALPNPQHYVRVYRTNLPDRRSEIIILITKLSTLMVHRIISLLPGIFNINLETLLYPISVADMTAFAERRGDEFAIVMRDWLPHVLNRVQQEEAERLHQQLDQTVLTMANTINGRLANNIEQQVARRRNDIQTIENQLRSKYLDLRNLMMQAQLGRNEAVDLLADYIRKIPDLLAVYERNTYAYGFVIQTTLQHYSQAEAASIERACRNRGDSTKAHIVKALFIDEEYQAIIRHGFFMNFDPNTGNSPYGAWSLGDTPFAPRVGALWNPHMKYFSGGEGCWGENGPHVSKFLAAGDYIAAFNQCLSAMRSIYLNDGAAANHLYADIMSGDYRNNACIRRVSDGAVLTCGEFISAIDQ